MRDESNSKGIRQSVEKLVANVEKKSGPAKQNKEGAVRRGAAKRDVEKWLDYETQARTMALAGEFGWPVNRVVGLAVNLLAVQLRDPRKRKSLIEEWARKEVGNG